jgi:hypothetical protein
VGFPNRHHVERLFRTDVCQSVVYEKSQLPNMLQSQFASLIADSDAPFFDTAIQIVWLLFFGRAADAGAV